MAQQQSVARGKSRSKRQAPQQAEPGTGANSHEDEAAKYEKELAAYLQERIKPGLNRGAIPLLARSIAKDIAHRGVPNGTPENGGPEDESTAEGPNAEKDQELGAEAEASDEPSADAGDGPAAEADEDASGEEDDEPSANRDDDASAEDDDDESAASEAAPDFEADMRELQAELGEHWILRFSVQGDNGWLTAEKDDGSQRLEAPNAAVLAEAVGLLNESGDQSS